VNNTNDKDLRNDIPPSVKLYDVLAAENPKRNGFGDARASTVTTTCTG